jgi:hypothetical protein
MRNKLVYILLILLISGSLFAQDKKKEKRKKALGTQTSFGIIFNPIIPTNLLQTNDVIKTTDTSMYSVASLLGYEFGMEIRHSFTKKFSLQSGITFIRRNYDAKAELYSQNETANEKLKLIAYEIPIKLIGFVRLSDNIYMDIAGGFGFEMYPSNIYVNHFYGQKTSWIQVATIMDVGWEYRSRFNGTFHIGVSYKLHFTDMMHVIYSNKYGTRIDYVDVSGNYLALNFKYFFPQKK